MLIDIYCRTICLQQESDQNEVDMNLSGGFSEVEPLAHESFHMY